MPFECLKCGASFYSETEFHEHEIYELVQSSLSANTANFQHIYDSFQSLITVLADISNEFQIHSVLQIRSREHCSFEEATRKYIGYWKILHDVTQRKRNELQEKKQEKNHEQR